VALNLPNTLSSLIFDSSPSATLVQQSLTTAVQPVLNFINQNFSSKGSGNNATLAFQNMVSMARQLLVSSGSLTAPGIAFNDAQGVGFFYDAGNKRLGITFNGVLVGYLDATGLTAPAALAVGGNATVTGTMTANSVVSAQGFKGPLWAGALNNVTLNASTGALSYTADNGGTWYYVATHPGSVVGISGYNTGAATVQGGVVGAQYFLLKNGTAVQNGPSAGYSGGAVFQAYSKGALPFAAKDYLTVGVRSSGTSTVANAYVHASLTLEMGA
jgi:hypothetical protein